MTRKRYNPKGVSEKNNASEASGKYRNKDYGKGRINKAKFSLFPKFTHSRSTEQITTYDDEDYLSVINQPVRHDNADAKTAFKNLLIAAYKEGRISGNMKDIVTDEETAYSVLGLDAFLISFELAYTTLIRELLANPAESDTTGGSATVIANITYTSFVQKINEIEAKELVIPEYIIKLVRELVFVIRLQDEYSQGAVQLSPSFVVPFVPDMTLAEMEAFILEWSQKMAQAKLHMDKFGIKYSVWNSSIIEDAPELPWNDIKALQYFSMKPIKVRAASNDYTLYPDDDISTTATWTSLIYYFKNSIDEESALYALLPLFHPYNATYNPYGGILSGPGMNVQSTQTKIAIIKSAYNNTSTFECRYIETYPTLTMLFRCMWKQTDTVNISITGSYLTGDNDMSQWPISTLCNLKYGTGLTKTTIEGILKRYLIKNMF
jgi:hypothetical protein